MNPVEPNPDQAFPGKQEGEKVIIFARRHWIAFLPDTVVATVAALVPIIILVALSALGYAPFQDTARIVTVLLVPSYYLTLATWLFIRWLDYYLDIAIVTDRRILDIDQYGLFRRRISELNHEVVQDVSTEKDGPLQTFFNFGSVVVQTAGERENFQFSTIPQPDKIAEKINEMQQAAGDGAASDKFEQAAEKMEEAAEKIADTVSAAPANSVSPPADSPAKTDATKPTEADPADKTEESAPPSEPPAEPAEPDPPAIPAPPVAPADDGDLPREYER